MEGGDHGCGYKTLRGAGGPPLPGRRTMALHVGLLLVWVCWRLSVVGQLLEGEERCHSIWGWASKTQTRTSTAFGNET